MLKRQHTGAGGVPDKIRQDIEVRLADLKPLIEEYERLEAASVALGPPRSKPAKPKAARRPRPNANAATRKIARRRKPKREWSGQTMTIIHENPGIGIPTIAERIGDGVKHNHLYAILRQLSAEGLVVREGRSWHPPGWQSPQVQTKREDRERRDRRRR